VSFGAQSRSHLTEIDLQVHLHQAHGDHMELKAFCLRTRQFFPSVTLNETAGTVRLTPRRWRVKRDRVILLPATGLTDASGEAVFLGDTFTHFADGREETLVVGPLPAAGVIATEFELRGFSMLVTDKAVKPNTKLPLNAEVLAKLKRKGNVYESFDQYVPENAHYCYKGLGFNGSAHESLTCPFWQQSDHGFVYCRLAQLGSLMAKPEASDKALAHYGNWDAVHAADNAWPLWDQVKCCDVNRDEPEDE
jgi:hypothetical protein